MRTDVLICGAGPVGLCLAAQLQAMGVSYQIIDKNRQRSEKSKALVVWGRSLELLNICMDASEFVDVGRPVRKARFFDEGVQFAEIKFSRSAGEFGTGVLIPQSLTEKLLENHLQLRGAEVQRETELLSFEQRNDEVACVLQNADGSQNTVNAKYLVGCDGAHSVVRHGLGFAFSGRKDGLRWVLADVELSGDVPDADVASLWSRAGILLLFHFGENVWRVVAEERLADDDVPKRDPTLQEIQKHLNERGAENVRASNPTWLSEFRVSERKVENYRAGRVFLAGDAAHVHSPAGGQGMNTGIQDSCNLAWKLAWNLRGTANSELLDTYSNERSEVGAMVVKATSHMTRLATTESRVLQTIRNTVAKIALHFDWVQDKVRQNLAEYSVAYRSSQLNGSDARSTKSGLKCGDRVPDVRWIDASGEPQALYQYMSGGRAVFLVLGSTHNPSSQSWGHGICGAEESLRSIHLVVVDELSAKKQESRVHAGGNVGRVHRDEINKLELGQSGWLIIRPDGYLAAAGECEHMEAATQWLDRFAND